MPLFLKVSNRFVLEPVTLSSTYGTMGSTVLLPIPLGFDVHKKADSAVRSARAEVRAHR